MTGLVGVEEYRAQILGFVRRGMTRRMHLGGALGLVLGEQVRAPFAVPPFTSSAMDGFAVRSADVVSASIDAPVELEVASRVRMGKPLTQAVGCGEAVAVPTGGAMPAGADSVVPVERCCCSGNRLLVWSPVEPGRHVRPAGEDLGAGDVVLEKGGALSAGDLAALAAVGREWVEVVPRVRVGIVSTGDELVRAPRPLKPGQIYDSNAFMLAGQVREAGAEPVDLGPVPDDAEALRAALESADVNVLVCSAGVSAGADDPVKVAFAGTDEVCFLNVAMRPGRPQAFGSVAGRVFFGLPGNPFAAFVSFEKFVRPALRRMMALPEDRIPLEARIEGAPRAHESSTTFWLARGSRRGKELVLSPAAAQHSNLVIALARADFLIEMSPPSGCVVTALRELTGNEVFTVR